MKFKSICAVALLSTSIVTPGIAGDNGEFYEMCHATSLNDGLDDASAGAFCSCLTDAVSDDADLYNELFDAGSTIADLDARLATLSDAAKGAAQSCQG